jgi:hypothetical protein
MKNNLWIFACVIIGSILGGDSYGNEKDSSSHKESKISQTLQKRYQSVLKAWDSLDKRDIPQERLRKMKEDAKLKHLLKKFIKNKNSKKEVEEIIKEYIGFLKARIERKKNHGESAPSAGKLKNNQSTPKLSKKEIKSLEEKISDLEKIMAQ